MSAITTIDELKAAIGQELSVSEWTEVTQERVNDFAKASGDHQWIHVDVERAKTGPYGGTIAHGQLTLSMAGHLPKGPDSIEVNIPMKLGINYGMNKVRFMAPVKVGKRVRSRSKLMNVEDISAGIVQVTRQTTVEIEGEEKPAMVAESLARYYL
jgi:acyl dehydratase